MPSPLDRLRELVRIPTISRLDSTAVAWHEFDRFRDELVRLYPGVHETLDRELVLDHSMLYRWKGASDGPPTVLMAHYDVVAASDEGWTHGPFSGDLTGEGEDQLVWGRGTLDDKGVLVAVLDGVEAAIAAGHVPANDIYLSFGHDEEIGGDGAKAIVDLLLERGIRPGLVLDEGGAIVQDIFPGVKGAVAVIGVSEKGQMSVTLTVDQDGGHAATPPRFSATARLARAILRLNSRPFRANVSDTTLAMMAALGAHAKNPLKWIMTNGRLTRPLLRAVLARASDETNAMLRTTQAVTMLTASDAANALAERAVATVNVRVSIDSSVEAAVAHIRSAIRDPLVKVALVNPNEPSPVSPKSGEAWDRISATIESVFPGTIVTPYVTNQASDSRQFTRISQHVYRFSPFEMSREERGTLHAIDERMHVATFLRGVEFYTRLVLAS